MLVVSRRRNESIMISDNVEVKIIDIRQNQVKVGITAPTSIPVHRREVYERIKAQEAAAAAGNADEDQPVPAGASEEKAEEDDGLF